jgi:hypothetical protein
LEERIPPSAYPVTNAFQLLPSHEKLPLLLHKDNVNEVISNSTFAEPTKRGSDTSKGTEEIEELEGKMNRQNHWRKHKIL